LRRALEAEARPESQRVAGPEQDSELALPKLSLAQAVQPALPALPLEPVKARLPSAALLAWRPTLSA
jgi:hypothetical protein